MDLNKIQESASRRFNMFFNILAKSSLVVNHEPSSEADHQAAAEQVCVDPSATNIEKKKVTRELSHAQIDMEIEQSTNSDLTISLRREKEYIDQM